MKAAIVLSALLSARAIAAPDPAALMRSALPPGFAPVAAFDEPIFIPVPTAVLTVRPLAQDTQTVALAALLDRHLSTTDSFAGAAGTTLVAGTLDLNGDGYLAVTPPGGTTRFVKIERGMSGGWSDGVHAYRVNLSVNIFRPRLANYIVIRDTSTGQAVWEKRISELFRLTNRAGEPVVLAGRAYRLFYSLKPTNGFCFIYDDTSNGGHDYKFYMVPLSQVVAAAPTSYKLYGGDVIRLRVSPDLATLEISR
ncbi:MAG: hypothetical protein HY923_02300 [Elusimicrobia bacterium]|nr:hypothetical protein [Elusimicrobiota bacterium]